MPFSWFPSPIPFLTYQLFKDSVGERARACSMGAIRFWYKRNSVCNIAFTDQSIRDSNADTSFQGKTAVSVLPAYSDTGFSDTPATVTAFGSKIGSPGTKTSSYRIE